MLYSAHATTLSASPVNLGPTSNSCDRQHARCCTTVRMQAQIVVADNAAAASPAAVEPALDAFLHTDQGVEWFASQLAVWDASAKRSFAEFNDNLMSKFEDVRKR